MNLPERRKMLEVDIAGIKMKTLIIGASGTFGNGGEYDDFLDWSGIGCHEC